MASKEESHPVKELLIPVPYGFIAAKAWGNKNGLPVLALHGWQDNAGTFDALIPLLSPSLYVVAVDFPGHGFSSHKPVGSFYHLIESAIEIKRITEFLNWEKFSIIGHSLGGCIALMYGSIFPTKVMSIITLDIIKPSSRSVSLLPKIAQKGIENHLHLESKAHNAPRVYSWDNAIERLKEAVFGEITDQSARILLKRGSKPSECGQGVVFTRDIRVKATEDLQVPSHDALKVYMSKLNCNLLIILGKDSVVFRSKTPEVLDEFLKIYRNSCATFRVVEVEGNHFAHLNNPHHLAPHINSFLSLYGKSKL